MESTVVEKVINNQAQLKQIAKWGKITGIAMMVLGAFSALSGIFMLIIGAIPGALTVFMGYLIYNSAQSAENMLGTGDEANIGRLLENYGKYLFINGILIIVSVVLLVLMMLIFGGTIFALLSYM